MHRNVADDSRHGGGHSVVVQFDLLLIHLLPQRLELRDSGIVGGLGIVEFLLAHNAGFKQFAFALKLRLGIAKVGFLRRMAGLLASQGGLLFQGIDLQERSAGLTRSPDFTKILMIWPST